MRVSRPALVLALAGSLLAAGTAGAATKPKPKPLPKVCNLLVDPKGDAQFLGQAPNDPNSDILSADVASDAKNVTAVLRLASFATADAQSPLGRGYYVLFSAPGSAFPVFFNMQITPDTTAYRWGDLETLATGNGSYVKKGDATGAIDTAKGTITITVPVADVKAVANVAPGQKITAINAASTAVIGTSATGGLVSTVDKGEAAKGYVAGQPSCVVPGKG